MLRIFLETREKEVIAREFGCSMQHVYRALRGDRETPAAMRVRERALELGGVKQRRRLATNDPPAGDSPASVTVKSKPARA
jgi:hypothetical protein